MNTIIKLIAFSFALFLSLNIVVAQQGESNEKHMKNPEVRAQKQTQRMTEDLSLSEAQISQVAKINLTFAEKMKAAKAANSEKETCKNIRTEHSNAIKAVLNTEQITQFDAMKDNRGHKGKRGKGHHKGGTKSSEERAAHHTERLTEKLSLNEAQATKIAAINLEFAKKADAIKEANEDREAGREEMNALRTEQKTVIKAVLNTEQITQFDAMKDKRGHKGKRGKGHHKGGAKNSEERAAHHTERLTEKLSLNETQATKIAAINLEFAKKAEAIKAANKDREAGREEMNALRAEQKAAIKTVLTPEQVTQFDAMKDKRGPKGRRGKKE